MTARQLKITGLEVTDVRFPTSFDEHGSDASHPAPDYSAVYVRLTTNSSQFFTRPSIQWGIKMGTWAESACHIVNLGLYVEDRA